MKSICTANIDLTAGRIIGEMCKWTGGRLVKAFLKQGKSWALNSKTRYLANSPCFCPFSDRTIAPLQRDCQAKSTSTRLGVQEDTMADRKRSSVPLQSCRSSLGLQCVQFRCRNGPVRTDTLLR